VHDHDAGVRRAGRWVATGLRVWPEPTRRRDGRPLLAAVTEELAAAARRGRLALLACALAEWAAVVRTGLALRLRRPRRRSGPGRSDSGEREMWTMGWIQDARLAARSLLRRPGFTAAAVGTLALGIGANAAVFDLVERVLLRPPPFARPDELVLVWGTSGERRDHVPLPGPDAALLAERAASLGELAFVGRSTDAALAAAPSGGATHVTRAWVSPNLFSLLGVEPTLGRGFLPADAVGDAVAGAAALPVLVSESVWRRVFAASPDAMGRTAYLDAGTVTVVGVVPDGFRLGLPPAAGLGGDPDVWVPIRGPLSSFERPDGRSVDRDSDNTGAVLARLATGATVARADAEVAAIARALRREVPGYEAVGYGLTARPLHADVTAHARPLLVALLAGAAGLLLVACLSVAALLVARGSAREGEIAVRVALGARRERVARMLLSEVLAVVVAAGVASVAVAATAGAAVALLAPGDLLVLAASPGGPPLPFLAACVGVSALVLGVVVATQAVTYTARAPRGPALRRFASARGREAVVVAEVAAAVVLVLGAGLLLRTAAALRAVDAGFVPDSALVFDASVRMAAGSAGPAERARLIHEAERVVRGVPGVRAVGLTNALPLSGRRWVQPWGLPGEADGAWSGRRADFRMVTSGYFEAVGTPLLEGRTFTSDEDLNERRRVVVVDRTLARRVAPGRSAVGAEIGVPLDGEPVRARIVGVVEQVRSDALDAPGREAIYVPYRQEASVSVSFVVRTSDDPAVVAPAVREALGRAWSRLAIRGMQPMVDYVDAALAPTRFGLALLGAYATLALLAAALGLYGVVAWEVGRRTRDLGVRMAVGATAGRVRAAVLARGARLLGAGLVVGCGVAAFAAAALRRLVYGVGVADPVTWAGVLAVVGGVTLLACWIPARRASRLDPSAALRAD
jgi:predicted permease